MRPVGYFTRPDGLEGVYKAPGDAVDYAIDWTQFLPSGVQVQSATWSVPAGLSGGSEGLASPIATKRISGGTPGQEYLVTCQMTKTNGERVDRTIVIMVRAELS